MDGNAGHNSGFGRIGVKTRTSMYTPVHLASSPLPSGAREPARHASSTRALAGAAIAVLVVVAAALAAGVVLKLRAEPMAAVSVPGTLLPSLDHEAERLSRSAFATHRGRS